MKKYILLLSAAMLLAFGCQENLENPNDNNNNSSNNNGVVPTPGQEVIFGASMNEDEDPEVKTIYGDETNNAFPIYWLKGDQVVITSPQCAEGRRTAVYQTNCNDGSEYAGSLTKVGETGIQWGDTSADFYSVYPAEGVTADITDPNNIKFNVSMPAEQRITVSATATSGLYSATPEMDGCFMYAKSLGVNNGSTVDLKYTPFSTALRFKLRGPQYTNKQPVHVTKVEVIAPYAIAGDFTATIAKAGSDIPSLAVRGTTSNTVTVIATHEGATGYLTLAPQDSVELNAFITIPSTVTEPKIDANWKIKVTLSDGRSFTKSLGLSGSNNTLVRGKIHRLPSLPLLLLKK